MVRTVRRIGDNVLRKKANKVEKINRDLLKLIDDMVETMHAQDGVGLAAPQVGIEKRLAVVEVSKDEKTPGSGQLYVLINPEIVRRSAEKQVGVEGCLSIPGWRGEVERAHSISVKFQDRDGNRQKIDVEGYVAVAFQHEIDHLDGVLYIDKLVAPDRIWSTKTGEEAKR
jgi:peptide deformylase